MSYQSPYETFVFEDYSFDITTATAEFHYSFDGQRHFIENVTFSDVTLSSTENLGDGDVLDKALQLSFYVAGTSYYKSFPTKEVKFKKGVPNQKQAEFLQRVYTEGLSQFIFENGLTADDIAIFNSQVSEQVVTDYAGEGVLALQSGGKDSLLLATLLNDSGKDFAAMYISASGSRPTILDTLGTRVRTVKRSLDSVALKQAADEGSLNGHVPVTYIVESYAIVDAILHNEKAVLASIGAEGNEPHEFVGSLPVNHQWSKTWEAEQLLSEYVYEHITPSLQIGSPLRGFSELRIAELFVQKCWETYGHSFSSCNRANYRQGSDNSVLKWCGDCPKCANSYLLFAPFVAPQELQSLFAGKDLFKDENLNETFKGLLGLDGVMKPFECVGEVDELRLAYQMAREKFSKDYCLPFDVPSSNFEYKKMGPNQQWVSEIIG